MLTEKKRNVRERELQKYKYVVREAVNFEEFERRCIKVFSFFTLLILEVLWEGRTYEGPEQCPPSHAPCNI